MLRIESLIDKGRGWEGYLIQLARVAHWSAVCVIRGRNCPSRGIRADWSVTLGIWVHSKPRAWVGTFLEDLLFLSCAARRDGNDLLSISFRPADPAFPPT